MAKKTNMKPVTMDILSGIYLSTLHVGSGHTPESEEFMNQDKMARKLIRKHGVSGVLAGLFYAYYTLAQNEILQSSPTLSDGITRSFRTGRIGVKVSTETYQLRPYFKGLDAYFYERWPQQIDDIKMQVCNLMKISVEWGKSFLNFPYDPDQSYQLDEEAKPVEVDLSGMPEESVGDNFEISEDVNGQG